MHNLIFLNNHLEDCISTIYSQCSTVNKACIIRCEEYNRLCNLNTQKRMLKAMEDLHLDVGISLVFSRMNEFNEPQKLVKFVHPALYRLREYDQETGNELYHTLEVYLQSFHNNKETANILCIHRNFLAYRMEKICDIAKIDLNDSTTEFLLRLSYKLAEYLEINDL